MSATPKGTESSSSPGPPRPSKVAILESRMQPTSPVSARHEPWYKYGVAVLCLEMLIALTVSAYALYLTFEGVRGLR